jgi:hypothetical protein
MKLTHLRSAILAALAAATLSSPVLLQAQTAVQPDPRCTAAGQGGDACQKALDLFHYLNPQFGTLIAGGNATLGQGGTLGGLGRFALALRVNATDQLAVPDLEDIDFQEGAPRRSSYTTTQSPGGFPVADLALGLYKGYPLGPTRVGGVDALVNVFYLPESATQIFSEGDGLSLAGTETGLKLGFGARVGLVEEGRLWPGVSVSYLRRSLPTVNVSVYGESSGGSGSTLTNDTIALRDFRVQTDAWRLVAGKRFLWIFNLAAGIGQDRYDTGGQLAYAVRTEQGRRIRDNFDFGQQASRTNMFADLSINLFLFRLVGEIGRVSGGDVQTFNQFGTDPNAPRTYGALGIRIGR